MSDDADRRTIEDRRLNVNTVTAVKMNTLFGLAFAMVIMCLFIVVLISELNEYAKGIITLILGRFLGYTDNVYTYEFGVTRSGIRKDATIADLAKTTIPAGTVTTTVTTGENVTNGNGTK
jgi:hypothetical protein